MAEPRTHYDVLGVASDAPVAELRRAYLGLARRHHPDHAGGDPERMRSLNAAWETLRDPVRRARYDASLSGWPAGRAAAPQEPVQPPSGDTAGIGDDLADLLADLEDDTPIGGQVVLPRWLSLLPVGLFLASVVLGGLGMLMAQAALLGFSVVLFLLSCLLFIASPFLALLASRRNR